MSESSSISTPPSSHSGDFESLEERAERILQEIDSLIERIEQLLAELLALEQEEEEERPEPDFRAPHPGVIARPQGSTANTPSSSEDEDEDYEKLGSAALEPSEPDHSIPQGYVGAWGARPREVNTTAVTSFFGEAQLRRMNRETDGWESIARGIDVDRTAFQEQERLFRRTTSRFFPSGRPN